MEGSREGARVGFDTLVTYGHRIIRRGLACCGLLVITRGRRCGTTRARFHNGGRRGVGKLCNIIGCFVQNLLVGPVASVRRGTQGVVGLGVGVLVIDRRSRLVGEVG